MTKGRISGLGISVMRAAPAQPLRDVPVSAVLVKVETTADRSGGLGAPHRKSKIGAAVDDESSQDNEKHNCGSDRPPIIFRVPWIGPSAIVAARVNHIH